MFRLIKIIFNACLLVLAFIGFNAIGGQKYVETAKHHITTFIQERAEENAKKLIKEQKYSEAIEILRAISLNNPKKSANFALQIKFLETIINNHNKK